MCNRKVRGMAFWIALAGACVGMVFAPCLAPVSAKTQSAHPPSSRARILGRYAARPIIVGPNAWPPALVCKTLVDDFNQFRDVPFASNNPRLSPQ